VNRFLRSSSERHVAFNLAGQLLPLLVALATVPATVARLGAERFGLLALALTTLGISTILDVSFARTVTKFCSEALARGEPERLRGVLRSAVLLQFVVGLAFAGAVFVAAPLVIERGLKVPVRVIPDACLAFRILAAAAVPNLVLGCFRGFLEAHRRFDLVNLVRGPGAALSFLLPWVGARSGWSLASIALALLLARALLLVVLAALCLRIDGGLLRGWASHLSVLSIAKFSGYVTASDTIPALFAAWDQFLLGAFASLGAVASFSVPNEIVLRLWVIPTSVSAAFFPVLSAACAREDWSEAARTLKRSAKGILLLLGGPVLVLLAGGPRLLAWWMGARFAEDAARVLQVLSVGMLLGSLSLIATSFLQAEGRPDLTARLRLIQVPVWLFAQWKLTESWGLLGAAAGVVLRSGFDAALLLGVMTARIRRRRG
jgi:O-antigen/teichoic acid export membrane protein